MNWLILIAIIVIGATVRHFFNLKNKGHLNIWILPAAMAAIFCAYLCDQTGGFYY
jgi:uncharacterized membrane protein